MRPETGKLFILVTLLATILMPHIAAAKIKCEGRYQVTKQYGLISTPYCEDNYLAAIDGVIGRRFCGYLKIWGAALQADGETRSVYTASSIRRRSVSHGPFCWIGRFGQGDECLHCG